MGTGWFWRRLARLVWVASLQELLLVSDVLRSHLNDCQLALDMGKLGYQRAAPSRCLNWPPTGPVAASHWCSTDLLCVGSRFAARRAGDCAGQHAL
mmetsp:Transcript_35584/g.85688  ORF Transcript_35584/g.85688 Transcript_35584/m.85688 type:complete len:96 (-) Transcript_35584:2-289(-)